MTVDLAEHADFRIGDVGVSPSVRRLDGPAGATTLEPRVMQVMVALATADGAVLSRDALVAACWDGSVVGDDAVHRAISGVRRGLRDAGATTVELQTVPKVGYRLVVFSTVPASPALPAAQPSARRRRLWLGATAAVIGAPLALYGWHRSRDTDALRALFEDSAAAQRLAVPDPDRQGVQPLQRAVTLSPRHAGAWGRLALAWRAAAEFSPPDRMATRMQDAEGAARRALSLDPTEPHAHTALALRVPTTGHWREIDERLRAVLEDHPQHLPALDAWSLVLSGAGMVAEHYPLRLRTVQRDPLHAGYNFRSVFAHWVNGAQAAADNAGARGLELWPGHLATWLARLSMFLYTDRAARALAMLNDDARPPALPPPLHGMAHDTAVALLSGRPHDRAATVDTIGRSLAGGGPLMAVSATMHLAALGEVERALDVCDAFLLERGPVTASPAWTRGLPLHNDVRRRFTSHLFTPVMAAVRAHPRFAALVQELGLSAFWRATRRHPDYLAGQALP